MTPWPEPRLHAVDAPGPEPLSSDGLELAYAALERVRAEHGLDRLTLVLEDPSLGRQLLVCPRGELPGPVGPDAGPWLAEPELTGGTDLDLAGALCRVSVRDATDDGGLDGLELELRRLDGVDAVGLDSANGVVRVQTAATDDTVTDRALEAVRSRSATLVLEVIRLAPAVPPSLEPIVWATTVPLEVVAVRADAPPGEIEVHLRGGDVRTVGRAPASAGLVGAAEAALSAWHARPAAPRRSLTWARVVESAGDTRYVVAVAIADPHHVTVAHGIGGGSTALDAAARATADALSR